MHDMLAHRRGEKRLRLYTPEGLPLGHAVVTARQTRQAFLFGFGAFDAVAMAAEGIEREEAAFLEDRLRRMTALCNYGTLPFYWGRFEPSEGAPMTQQTIKGARWLKEQGITLKGHPLCWHTVCADWLMACENEAILDKQLARIRREVDDFKGLIDAWDVINEVVIMPVYDRYDNAVTRIARQLGRMNLVREVFGAAREMNPKATLLLNDFNMSSKYEQLIEECLAAGVPIDAIGLQSHQHQGYWGREKLEDVLSRFSRFGLPLHFTENTMVSGDLMPAHIVDLNDWQPDSWPTTPEGEERQARDLSEMYRVLYAYPAVQAITNWDCVDGKWLGAPSGLLRRDNSEKPAYHALKRLIRGEWWTPEQRLVTDEQGWLTLRGFLGSYELSHEGRQQAVELDQEREASLRFT